MTRADSAPDASAWPLAAPRSKVAAAIPELAAMKRRRRHPEAMQAHQLERVRALVAHAARAVPVYDGAITAEHVAGLHSLDDLAALPVIDKRWFVDRGSGTWPVPAGAPVHRSTTSGTTG